MNITIFGGTGPAGILVIAKALEGGHHVTVFAMEPKKISTAHDNLTKLQGELSDRGKIDVAIVGADALISLLGPKRGSKELQISKGYSNIITAMHKYKVRRLIMVVSSSYSDPLDNCQFTVSCRMVMLKVLAPSKLKDILAIGELVRYSGLDWTIARVPMLRNTPPKGAIDIGYVGDGKFDFFDLSRADLANFMISQLTTAEYIHKAPAISK